MSEMDSFYCFHKYFTGLLLQYLHLGLLKIFREVTKTPLLLFI